MACTVEHVENIILSTIHAADTQIKHLVDMTIETLSEDIAVVSGFRQVVQGLTGRIQKCERSEMIDPNHKIAPEMERCEKVVAHWVDVLRKKRQAALTAPELNGRHEQDVVTQYERTIGVVVDFHNALVELRWSVLEYDADLDTVVGKASSADELIERLNA